MTHAYLGAGTLQGVRHDVESDLERQQIEELLRLLGRYDEFDLHGQRAGEREQSRLMQHVMAAEAGHGLEGGAAADIEPGALLEQPFPYEAAVMPVTLVSVEAEE